MGKLESAFRDEIVRLSRKTMKKMQSKIAEDVRRLKKRVADLQTEIAALKSACAKEASKSRMVEAAQSVAREGARKARLSPGLIRKLRKRLNVSQAELAVLLGVSAGAVGFWESGKSSPRPAAKAQIVALRNLGRRDVKRLLSEKSAQPASVKAAGKRRKKHKTAKKK